MTQFRTKARAIELLGKNQIADLPTAITELWKNGYDAYGDKISAELFKAGYKDIDNDTFVIADDGFGMSRDDIENKWVVLGTENKKNAGNVIPNEDMFNKKPRIPLGEKGIGRLSVTYLGSHMFLVTKKQNGKITVLFMNWSILENFELFLDDIDIPVLEIEDSSFLNKIYKELLALYKKNLENGKWQNFPELKSKIQNEIQKYSDLPSTISDYIQNHYHEGGHGTIFVVFNPIHELSEIASEKGEDEQEMVSGNEYLISAMSGLFNPFDEKVLERRKNDGGKWFEDYPCFNVYEKNKVKWNYLLSKGEFFTQDEFKDCENWIDGEFDEFGVFTGSIKVFGEVIPNYIFSPMSKKCIRKCGNLRLRLAFWEGVFRNTTMTKEKYEYYENKGKLFSGLYIYRDCFRVLPYGRTDFDFLDFEKRRSNNAGRYYFSHRKMFGCISISKKNNPLLIDKAGREGMVANSAYRELKELLMDFFIDIADNCYGRKSESRKDLISRAKKKQAQDKMMEEESKRQDLEIKKLRKEIYANSKKIEELKNDIIELKENVKKNTIEGYLIEDAQQCFYTKYREICEGIQKLRVQLSPAINLKQFDEDYDYYTDYQSTYNSLQLELSGVGKNISELTYVNKLKDLYSERVYEIKKELKEREYSYYKQFDDKSEELREQLFKYVQTIESTIDGYLPNQVNISNMSEEKTRKLLSEIEIKYDNIQQVEFAKIKVFLDYYNEIVFGMHAMEVLGAYRTSNAEMREENMKVFELAQVGMAIEQQDHQFNSLYGQINECLRGLQRPMKDSSAEEKFAVLKMSFQHLEDNYKKLQPLYRVSRKIRKNIKGQDIANVIKSFYGEVFEKNEIAFLCDSEFQCKTLFTYESIIMPVFLNIINNAVYWLKRTERKIIEIFLSEEGEMVVCNSGEKMKPSELEKCFDVFYSRKPTGRGIGLYLAKTTLRSVGMDIYSTSDLRYNKYEGACFVITNFVLED